MKLIPATAAALAGLSITLAPAASADDTDGGAPSDSSPAADSSPSDAESPDAGTPETSSTGTDSGPPETSSNDSPESSVSASGGAEVRAEPEPEVKPRSNNTKPSTEAAPAVKPTSSFNQQTNNAPAPSADPDPDPDPAPEPPSPVMVNTIPAAVVPKPAPAVVTIQTPQPVPVVITMATGIQNVLTRFGLLPQPEQPDSPLPTLALAALARRQPEDDLSSFGRMFPGLAPLDQQTNQQLADLAQTMLEPAAIPNPNGTTAGHTFFGQFIDHDLTLDTSPQPTVDVDPTTLTNNRTFAFDLDSVYGGGPTKAPQLYDGTGRFLIGVATDGVSPDLPRNPDGSAVLIEARNDENRIISQIHLSFLRLHNALMDQGMSFKQAQSTVINAYRYVVINDYLPQTVGQEAVNSALKTPLKQGFYDPGSKEAPMTPVEFSVAAFRFGHSQVRAAYDINDTAAGQGVRIFSFTEPDLRGGSQLPGDLVIDFDNFFAELPREAGDDAAMIGRAIDTKISPGLFALPIPGAEASGSNVLGFRNMLRAKFYDMPSFESVAASMNVIPAFAPVFPQGTPLWYGVLLEAELQGGGTLGPVGGRIVAETFVDVMRLSTSNGTAIAIKKPNLPDSGGGDFRIGDLLVAADLLEGIDG